MGYAGETPIAYLPGSSDVTIAPAAGESRLDIHNRSGIGDAIFWVMKPSPAGDLTFRLHLRGLEELTMTFGDQMVRASVSSHGDGMVSQTLVAGGSETPIDADSAYWMEISPSERVEGMAAYFDVGLPQALFEGYGMFRLGWIDFYR